MISQANLIGEIIWNEVQKWNHFQKETIGKQITRSADSISANLSESHGRYSYTDRKRFIYYARGSLCETINWLEKTIERGLIDIQTGKQIKEKLDILSLQINTCLKHSK